MEKAREPARTRKLILSAARREFSSKGFAGARMEGIASGAGVSKQLILHHFKSKEKLYIAVHELLSRPALQPEDFLSGNPFDVAADRFQRRVKNLDYVRLLTWEAAGIRNRALPGESERREQVVRMGASLRNLHAAGRLPKEMNYRMIHLAIVSLASYPLSFTEITRLITGRKCTDPRFQREWSGFLRQMGKLLLSSVETLGPTARDRTAKSKIQQHPRKAKANSQP